MTKRKRAARSRRACGATKSPAGESDWSPTGLGGLAAGPGCIARSWPGARRGAAKRRDGTAGAQPRAAGRSLPSGLGLDNLAKTALAPS